ncbi:MAG: N-acetylmuramoyl-L-alanine amidase [Deltaproteobacteria bacterium]|nr:MAG: N-acetylmuramoyl-L-alanine amidase [Deltaproteobacteria bacterium]
MHVKFPPIVSLMLPLLLLGTLAPTAQAADGLTAVRTIVLDPGHGGEDTGTTGPCGTEEKELVLQIAFQLRDALLERDPTLTVILTREEDVYVPLEDRTHLANSVGADLFVSIHLNGAVNPGAHGIETFFLAPEGTAIGEVVPGQAALGATRARLPVGVAGDLVSVIRHDLQHHAALRQSARLAEAVQGRLIAETGARDRNVREGRFRVLRGARMPAVVVELGFLTNAREGERLADETYQQRLVHALVGGLTEFDRWTTEAVAEWTPPPHRDSPAPTAEGMATVPTTGAAR